jgi:hypothetical protein
MRVRKMVMAAGVIALAVAGCGSAVTASPSGGAPSTKQGPAGPKIAECVGCATQSGSTATVPYPTEFRSELTTKLEVTVVAVEKGAIGDLKDVRLDDPKNKDLDPYYLKMKFRNVGDKATDPQTIFAHISIRSSDDSDLNGLGYHDDFAKCATNSPASLAPGVEYTECAIYVAPPGQKVAKVVYYDAVGPSTDQQTIGITWNVG